MSLHPLARTLALGDPPRGGRIGPPHAQPHPEGHDHAAIVATHPVEARQTLGERGLLGGTRPQLPARLDEPGKRPTQSLAQLRRLDVGEALGRGLAQLRPQGIEGATRGHTDLRSRIGRALHDDRRLAGDP